MKDEEKPKEQLIHELAELRQKIAELDASEAEHVRIEEEYLEKNRLQTIYKQIAQITLSSLNLDSVLDNVGKKIVEAGLFRSMAISLPDYESNSVETVRAFVYRGVGAVVLGESDDVGRRYSLDSKDILAETVRTGEVQVAVEWDERFDRESPREYHIGNVAYFIPVKKEDRVLAVLATGSTLEDKELTLQRIDTLQPFLDQLAIALENARLFALAEREIAERKNAEKELKKNEERYRMLIEQMPSAILVHIDGKFVFSNQAGLKLLGADSVGDLIRKPILDVVHSDFHSAVTERNRIIKEGYKSDSLMELKIVKLDGNIIDVETRATLSTFEGKPAVQVVAIDITERKKAESLALALARSEVVVQTAGAAAHKINQPLTAIIGMGDLLLRDGTLSDTVKNDLESIRDAGQKIASIVRDMVSVQEYKTEQYLNDIEIVRFDNTKELGDNAS
jgi:PAS domain S-box-containing protein